MDLALRCQSRPVLALFYRLDNRLKIYHPAFFKKKKSKYRYVSIVLSWILNNFSLKNKKITKKNAVMHLSHVCFLWLVNAFPGILGTFMEILW